MSDMVRSLVSFALPADLVVVPAGHVEQNFEKRPVASTLKQKPFGRQQFACFGGPPFLNNGIP